MTALLEPTADAAAGRVEASSRLGGVGPAHVIALALVLGAAITRLGPPGDPDTWWHLRTGEWVLDNKAIPHSDPWSAIAQGDHWVDHEWLSQIFWALSYRIGGYHGVSVFGALLFLAILSALVVQAFRRTSPYRALGLTFLVVLGLTGGWAARPQLVSFLLLIPTGVLLRRGIHRGNAPWVLIPIVWVWANLHGLWVLAPVLTLAIAVGHLIDHRDAATRLFGRHVLLALGMVVAAGLTPNGLDVLRSPIEVAGVGKFVVEWGPVPLTALYGIGFFGLLGIYALSLARSTEKAPWVELVPVLFAALLGLRYIRTVAPAVVILVPYVATRLAIRRPRTVRHDRLSIIALAATAAIGLVGAVIAVRETPDLPDAAPVAASEVINSLPGEQVVINEYGMGGWILWATPDAHPLIDGRAELYGNTYIGNYLSALQMAGSDWSKVLLRDDPTVAFLHRDVPAAVGLQEILGWKELYSDDTWLVLVPPARTEAGTA